jgi:hypothetical protein
MSKQTARHLSTVPARLNLAKVELRDFLTSLSKALPKLIRFVGSDVVRAHSLWGRVIPFHVPSYGSRPSLGHAIRPDILITKDGPKFTELDFVASGMGGIPSALGTEQAREVVDAIGSWFRNMGVRRIRFATASTTTADSECAAIAKFLRQKDWDAQAINIDTFAEAPNPKTVISRMFYSAEMKMPQHMRQLRDRIVITAEPWLDTKAVFALVHDRDMTTELERALGADNLAFLRTAMPETWLIAKLDDQQRDAIRKDQAQFVIKATDVETETCWGSRAVIPGIQCSPERFGQALMGTPELGAWPIVQKFHQSLDFSSVWNRMIGGEFSDYYPLVSERKKNIWAPIHEYVGAKFGVFFLVVNDRDRDMCEFIPYADTALRPNSAILYFADDAKPAIFQVV